ncbi:MAG: dihydrolipoamide acetyltransferase family protein [Candidatus Binataceae bacterium]
MAEFRMPSLGADMEVGTILQWLVKPGDMVKRGDIVAVVDTEKATIEIEVFQPGVVESIVIGEGREVPVGTVIAMIRADGEVTAPAATKPTPAPPVAAAPTPAPPPVPKPAEVFTPPKAPPGAHPHRLHVSPLAMRVALDLKVDLSTVKGTGPDGAITKVDVERAAKAPHEIPPTEAPPSPAVSKPPKPAPPGKIDHHVAMRRVIAAAMARSKREIPHYYLGTSIDMSRALAWLQADNLKRPVAERILYSVLLLKAVARAIHEVPEMNGFCVDGAFKPSAAVHVGVAISLRKGGLIAPAIHDVDQKSLGQIMADLRDLVKRVRAESLRSSEITDATITVTSLGEQGVETVFGIIYPPQVALVGFGKITERPWASNGMLGVKPVIAATLAADHRVSDGHRGGLLLAAIDRFLQEPEKL